MIIVVTWILIIIGAAGCFGVYHVNVQRKKKIDEARKKIDATITSVNEAIEEFKKVILESKTILWNGPMGVFEFANFQQGTKGVAEAVAEATQKGAYSLIGGGDSVSAINKFKLADKVSYVSTGGGAMLEYFEGKELPGVAAIANA